MARKTQLLACVAALCVVSMPVAQDENLDVPKSVLKTVGEILPERPSPGAQYLSSIFSPNLVIGAPARIRAVFLAERAGYRNSLGYFTYHEDAGGNITVLDSDLLFPDVTKGVLRKGDSVYLKDAGGATRVFEAGDRVGFFLIADGWNTASQVQNWTFSPGLPSADPAVNRDVGRGLFTSVDSLNQENLVGASDRSRHAAMVRVPGITGFVDGDDFYLLGFEDLDRTGAADDDFNECAFAVDVDPVTAAVGTLVPTYDRGDADGDGVNGMEDVFPDDPERSFITFYPVNGWYVVAYEDMYPISQDNDFDDAVFAFRFVAVTNRRNEVKDLMADYHLVGRGASFDHDFGLHIPKLPDNSQGTVSIERINSAGDRTAVEQRALSDVVHAHKRRIHGIFVSTRSVLPDASVWTSFANTQPEYPDQPAASARVLIEFDRKVKLKNLGTLPYDPYLISYSNIDGSVADIHLPGFESFSDIRSPHLAPETGDTSFVTADDNPWALLVPASWRFPLEGIPIEQAYPGYTLWRDSGGLDNLTWYETPVSPDLVSKPINDYIPDQQWTLSGPHER